MNMRSLYYPAILVFVTLFVTQCKNAEQDGPATRPQGKQVTITATLEQPAGTKTSLSSYRQVLWSEGDQIRIYNSSNTEGEVYTLSAGAGTTGGQFTGDPLSGDGPFYAIYPASAGGTLGENGIAVTLPSEQSYAAGSFGSGAAVSVAKANTIKKLNFKNVLGGVSLTVNSSKPFSGVCIQTKGDEALNGSGTITFGEEEPWEEEPSLSVTRTSDDNSFLYLKCQEAVSAPVSFVIMLPPGAFASGFLVEFLDSEGNVMFRSARAQNKNTVTRSYILDMPVTDYAAQYKAGFFESETFGYFPAIGAEAPLKALSYNEETGQYAYKNANDSRYVRVQNLQEAFYAEVTTPVSLTLGGSCQASVTTLEGNTKTSAGTKTFTVLKKTGNRVWLVNETDKTGIIQLMED